MYEESFVMFGIENVCIYDVLRNILLKQGLNEQICSENIIIKTLQEKFSTKFKMAVTKRVYLITFLVLKF